MHSRQLYWRLPAWTVATFVSCSLSNVDDLKGNAADAGAETGAGGKCVSGLDCSGCPSCPFFCACIAGPNVVQCMAGCQDGDGGTGGGAAGTAGSGGAGGGDAASGGAAGADAGTNCTQSSNCTECCINEHPAGASAYEAVIANCVCNASAACASACTDYCQSGSASDTCADCLTQPAAQNCLASYCDAACAAFIDCYTPCKGV